MKRETRRGRTAWLLALGLAACGTFRPGVVIPEIDAGVLDGGWRQDSGITMHVDAGLPLATACDVLNARRCEVLVRCGLLSPSAVPACLDTLTRSWCGPSTWPTHVARGALRYDALAAQRCADELSTRQCADFASLPDSCEHFLAPGAGLRASCFDGFSECLDGVCRGAACPRTCQPRGLMGEVCAVDSDCRPTLFCRLSTTTPGVGQCIAWAQEGEACDPGTKCAQPLECSQNKCRRVPTAGESCTHGTCDEASWCVTSGDAGLCVPRPALGEACQADQCLPDLVCDAMRSVCTEATVAAGQPCTMQQTCAPGTTCVGAHQASPGTCRTPLAVGATCERDLECDAEFACLPADGGRACATRLAAGLPCSTDRWCQIDATCTGGVCQRLPGPGEACTGACRVGTCVSNQDGGMVCAPWLGPGVPCTDDAQCESRRCVLGHCLTQCTP